VERNRAEDAGVQEGVEGPSVRKRTVASCTQCLGLRYEVSGRPGGRAGARVRGRFKIRVKSGHNGSQSKKVAFNQRLGVPLWQPKTPHANRRRRVLTVVSENGSADGRPRGTCFQQNRGSSRSSMKVNLCGQGRDLTSTQLVTTFYTYPQPTPCNAVTHEQ
jgi:hypothetical protein